MILVYHLICGIITLFAVTQVQDGKSFINRLRQECKGSASAGQSKLERVINWGFYLTFASAAWLVLWPLIVLAWAVAKIVKPDTEENPESEEN